MGEIQIERGSPSVDDFFAGSPLGRQVYAAVAAAVGDLGPATVRVTKSQVSFRRRTGFCFLWRPAMYLRSPAAEVVLSVPLSRHDQSPRWKQTVQVGRRWMHHLELWDLRDLDDEVLGWLAEAYDEAG